MSSSSDSEEFYDAEDVTPNKLTKRTSVKSVLNSEAATSLALTKCDEKEENADNVETNESKSGKIFKSPFPVPKADTEFQKQQTSPERQPPVDAKAGRRRFRELRQRMQTDDDDGPLAGNASPPDSQTSSVEGVYGATSRSVHPFRVIEQDTVSMQSINSLGRIGRILSGQVEAANTSNWSKDLDGGDTSTSTLSSASNSQESEPSTARVQSSIVPCACSLKQSSSQSSAGSFSLPMLEPDIVSSTKNAGGSGQLHQQQLQQLPEAGKEPIAPPRRKKKKAPSPPRKDADINNSCLNSPASTIESITKEFEHSQLISPPSTSEPPQQQSTSKSEELPRSSTLKSSVIGPEHSLDIRQATKGQYVVKPQDEDKTKAGSPAFENEPLKFNLGAHTSKQRPTNNSIGRGSLGSKRSPRNSNSTPSQSTKERRHSAGDEEMMKQMNMFVRTRTDSGKQLTDVEILEQVTVLNLDTGERVPLSIAEDKLPQCVNPLSLHIMRLTSEYVSNATLDKDKESDEESIDSRRSMMPLDAFSEAGQERPRRAARLKRFLGSTVKKTRDKVKSIAQEVSHARHKDDGMDIVDVVNPGEHNIKLKASNSHKGPYDFESTQYVQELQEHIGPVWCMKFSRCGQLLATGGQDRILRVWVVKDAFPFFQDMRRKNSPEKSSPTPSQESLMSHDPSDDPGLVYEAMKDETCSKKVFVPKPFTYLGHTADLLDVSWSKNYFVLSSSMDKTVRLWHISRKECLCCFQHIDFVTAIVFHPKDDRYFLSGSLDGKLRLWNIPDKKVALWTEVEGQTKLITAANFCWSGKFSVVGTYDGRCIFYRTDQLTYHTQIHVRSKRKRNARGRKISGIEPMPGEDKILVTSNDSRIRLYDLRDVNISCKYKGYVNVSSQIKASFSHDGKYIVAGSENRDIYIWKTHHDYSKFTSVRRDRNDFWEAIKAHNALVTCAVFASNPAAIIKMLDDEQGLNKDEEPNKVEDPMVEQRTKNYSGYVLVSADFNGCIKVFVNRTKPKHSSLPASALA